LINGHSYYTQTQWSNASTKTPSSPAVNGCAQRFGPSPSFTAPSTITTGTAATFNGSGSYDLASPITSYIWNFGDGSPVVGTTSAKPAHIYDSPGTYTVTLTVGDVSRSGQQLEADAEGEGHRLDARAVDLRVLALGRTHRHNSHDHGVAPGFGVEGHVQHRRGTHLLGHDESDQGSRPNRRDYGEDQRHDVGREGDQRVELHVS
jgi:hypothetical protein